VSLVAGSLAIVASTTAPAHAADGLIKINLVGVNDFHGRIDANTVKWAGTVKNLELDTPGSSPETALIVGGGDLIGASTFASASAGDQPTIDVMNEIGVDASAVGNHEFDKGWADLRDRVIANKTNAKWDYLGANVYQKGNQSPVLPEYATYNLKDADGDAVTVGVIGAVTQETPSLVSPDGISTLDFGPAVAAVNRVATQLSDGNPANGEADVLVAFHAGSNVTSSYGGAFAACGEFPAIATWIRASTLCSTATPTRSTCSTSQWLGVTSRPVRWCRRAPMARTSARFCCSGARTHEHLVQYRAQRAYGAASGRLGRSAQQSQSGGPTGPIPRWCSRARPRPRS